MYMYSAHLHLGYSSILVLAICLKNQPESVQADSSDGSFAPELSPHFQAYWNHFRFLDQPFWTFLNRSKWEAEVLMEEIFHV